MMLHRVEHGPHVFIRPKMLQAWNMAPPFVVPLAMRLKLSLEIAAADHTAESGAGHTTF